jgi:hypothetical protein
MPFAFLPENAVDALPKLSGATAKTLVGIASFMPGRGREGCFPSLAAIGERAGIRRENTIIAAIKELAAVGILVCERRKRKTNWLRWAILEPAKSAGTKILEPAVSAKVDPALFAGGKVTKEGNQLITTLLASEGSAEPAPLPQGNQRSPLPAPTAGPAKARAQAAARIDSFYRKEIVNPYNKKLSPKKSIPRIAAILKSGISEQQLTGAVKRYAFEAMKNDPEHRKGIRGFFSARDDMWEGYLADDNDQAYMNAFSDDYEISEADAALQLEIEREIAAERIANA